MGIQFESISVYIYPIFIILIALEYILAKQLFDLKESAAGFEIAVVVSLIAFFSKVSALAVFFFVFDVFKEFRVEYLDYKSFGY